MRKEVKVNINNIEMPQEIILLPMEGKIHCTKQQSAGTQAEEELGAQINSLDIHSLRHCNQDTKRISRTN